MTIIPEDLKIRLSRLRPPVWPGRQLQAQPLPAGTLKGDGSLGRKPVPHSLSCKACIRCQRELLPVTLVESCCENGRGSEVLRYRVRSRQGIPSRSPSTRRRQTGRRWVKADRYQSAGWSPGKKALLGGGHRRGSECRCDTRRDYRYDAAASRPTSRLCRVVGYHTPALLGIDLGDFYGLGL